MEEPLRQMIRRWAFPVLASAAVVAAAGCGAASSSQGGQVASIPSSAAAHSTVGAPSTAGSGSSATGGVTVDPQERLDDTDQQRNAIISAWNDCLVAHGATYGIAPGAALNGVSDKTLTSIPASATAACKSKEPVMPPQENPSLNPHYRADSIADVNCMRAHGVMVHLTTDTSLYPNGLAWGFDPNGPPLPANFGQIQQDCEVQAFSGK